MKKCLIPAMLLLMLTGCYDYTDQESIDRWITQAKTNAADYVKYKYDFDAEIISAKADKIGKYIGWESIDHVYVTMKHDGREFQVYIDGAAPCIVGKDSYQYPEIEEAYRQAVLEIMPNAEKIEPKFRGKMFSETYDGTNLQTFIDSYLLYVKVTDEKDIITDPTAIEKRFQALLGEGAYADLIDPSAKEPLRPGMITIRKRTPETTAAAADAS